MPAARCSICSLDFPITKVGDNCPVCEVEALDGVENAKPDHPDDLNRAVTRAQFERLYGPAEVD